MGKIVCVVNRKGGVGKTTTTIGIADTLAGATEVPYVAGRKLVVAVDLDPQASLSRALLSKHGRTEQDGRLRQAIENGRTLAALMDQALSGRSSPSAEEFLTHGVGPNGTNYSLLANEARAWDCERKAIKKPGEAKLKAILAQALKRLADQYKYVLVDCPPGQTVLAEAAVEAADLILCPITPDWLSYWGLESFDIYVRDLLGSRSEKETPLARFVFTKCKAKPTRSDAQNKIIQLVWDEFREPRHRVTLMIEVGSTANTAGRPLLVPFDSKVASRLEGWPHIGRIWPWTRAYSAPMQDGLLRLVTAMKKELGSG